MFNPTNPTAILTYCCLILALAPGLATPARADVRLDVRESAWAAGQPPVSIETLVRTWVRGPARRIENRLAGAGSDSAARATQFAQIDRLDRDSSYFVRPAEHAYIPVAYAPSRAQNRQRAGVFRAAQAAGTAPRDTLAPVVVTELGRTRTILGQTCRGVVLALTFAYRDSALGPEAAMTGVLADTMWLAPADGPAGEVTGFELELARRTAADSMLATATAVQLSQARGMGLVTVLQRARRGLAGVVLASHFVNLLRGLPPGLSGFERLPDGSAVVQRTVREAVALATDPLPDALFEPPPAFRRVERSGPAGRAGGAAAGGGGGSGGGAEKAPANP